MTGNDIRRKFLKFMEARDHAIVPSAALVPENDPTTLFTGSGMQPLVPYLMGETHPKGSRLANSQKCFRAEDIDEVGDNRHTTFFEMLGNWSLGDYFKKEQLPWLFEFLVDEVGLDPEKLYVTAFIGDDAHKVPKDTESAELWTKLFAERGVTAQIVDIGSEAAGYEKGMQGGRIFYYDAAKNWWSRAGKPESMPIGEIGGPDSEVFYDFDTPHDPSYGTHCHPNCDCGRFLEIGNSVFMEYIKAEDGSFQKLPKQNVDFGGGLERIAAASNSEPDVFKIDVFKPMIQQIEQVTGASYEDNTHTYRIILDHIRAAVFLLGDNILPSNKDQGYFVRRLIRRAALKANTLSQPHFFALGTLAHSIADVYGDQYPVLREKVHDIDTEITEEETKFRSTLQRGLQQFSKIELQIHLSSKEEGRSRGIDTTKKPHTIQAISAKNAFELFTTYGFPIELTEEVAAEKGLAVDRKGFEKLMEEHRDKSRAGAEQKFKGGLADHSEKVVQYHTATHLLLAGLRKELGDHVHQAGSNITGERLRFDFTHPEKVDRETLDRIELFVNNAITAGATVSTETMPKGTAEQDPTVEGSFWERYPDEVKVYTVTGSDGTVYSRELCGGPHVQHTNEITGKFKIIKEESSASGIRRIKAVLAATTE